MLANKQSISSITSRLPVKAIFRKRAATMEVDAFISPETRVSNCNSDVMYFSTSHRAEIAKWLICGKSGVSADSRESAKKCAKRTFFHFVCAKCAFCTLSGIGGNPTFSADQSFGDFGSVARTEIHNSDDAIFDQTTQAPISQTWTIQAPPPPQNFQQWGFTTTQAPMCGGNALGPAKTYILRGAPSTYAIKPRKGPHKGNQWARKGNRGPCNRNRAPF